MNQIATMQKKSNQIHNKFNRIKPCDYSDVFILVTGDITVLKLYTI